ncbi:DUF4062 domain-containing protein [Sulfurimonas sp. SAG-AH-194-I05]|nr:DUF4062 domain-containing protein [Sulfurimonas sp. SAG-AH-194-I05]MDF1876051.1 DUF4062 domain-containing protein [Sulfurimonas sp. SAG-AH-194-I05]
MQNNIFRLFISSPFSDFEKEREVLHKKVFPKIKKYCIKNNLTFQPIDLRWGVNEEAQLDQKTLEVCLEEVRECKHFPHPNFLIMAGNRYGYVPLPYMIEEDEWNNIIEVCATEDIPVLMQWYELDKNQIYTCRDNTKSTAYILQQRINEYKDYATWEKQESKLRKILQKAANQIFLPTERECKEYEKYFLSATEQEVIEGVCKFKDKTATQKECNDEIDKRYVFGYIRNIKDANDKYIDTNTKLQAMSDKFKDNLQKTLDKDNNIITAIFSSVKDYEDNRLKKFEEYIVKKLIDSINDQVEESKEISKLEQEISEQKKFSQDKVKGFQGRETTLTAIKNYIDKAETNQPLIIHGSSGMGKSSLMAKAIEDFKPDNKIFRFVGATADSSNIRTLLISITDELHNKKIIEKVQEYEFDNDKFDTQIKHILVSIKQKVTIFIDALDQLQHINYLNWLPDILQPNLKIILSMLNDKKYENDTHYYNLLNQRHINTNIFIDITKDSLEKNKEDLIINLLETENRQLDEYQTNYLLEKWEKTNYSPLYLKIAIEEVKHWKAEDKSQELNDGVEGIILEYLKNLTSHYHHEELLIRKVFGYIYASKDGLSEQELLQILSEDLEDDKEFRNVIINKYHKAIRIKNPRRKDKEEHVLPISIWSRLHTQIKPFIVERNIDNQPLMKFFHRQFNSIVEDFVRANKIELHNKMYQYFHFSSNERKAIELLFHAYKLNDTNKLFSLVFDENTLLININKGLLYEVFDYIKSLAQIKNIKKDYLKYKPLNIDKEQYFENLRYISYLLGSLDFEKQILLDWEFFDNKNSNKSFNLYKYLSDLNFRMGNTKKAINYSNLAKKYVVSDGNLLDLNLSLIRLYTFTGDIDNASSLINQIQNSNIENKLPLKKKAEYYQELSFPFHDTDNNKQFSIFNKKAKDIYKELSSRYDYCISGVNEGDGYWGSGILEKAKSTLEESLTKSVEWDLDHAINISHICLANLLSSINNIDENLKIYTTGIKLSKNIGHDWDEIYGSIYYNLAKAETLKINTTKKLIKLSELALKKNYHYLHELARSYSLIVSIYCSKYIQVEKINDLTINSAKIYHLAYDLYINKNKSNIDEIFKLLKIVDGIKGRPYIVYHILEEYTSYLNSEQKIILESFSHKCYLDSQLAKIYKIRINENV